jgi:hypothetical protein
MNEIEYLDSVVDRKLQAIFDLAVAARDEAQAALVAVQALKGDLLRRRKGRVIHDSQETT